MNEDIKVVAEAKAETMNPMQRVQVKPTLYDTHIKENFHIFGLASILYGILYVFCMYKNDAGITYLLFVA